MNRFRASEHYTAILVLVCAALLVSLIKIGQPSDGRRESVAWTQPPASVNPPLSYWSGWLANLLFVALLVWMVWPIASLIVAVARTACEYTADESSLVHLGQMLPLPLSTIDIREYGACTEDSCSKETYHLYSSQEPMVVWQSSRPEGAAYNECFAVWLEAATGTVSGAKLRAACHMLLVQHPTLRCRYIMAADSWEQHVASVDEIWAHAWQGEQEVSYWRLHYPEVPATDEHAAIAIVDSMFHKPLDIFVESSLRFGFVRLSPSKVLFYMVQHHSVTDGMSIPLLYQELSKFYSTSTWPACHAYNRYLGALMAPSKPSVLIDTSLHWWRAHLRGGNHDASIPRLDLPRDQPMRKTPSHEGIRIPLEISSLSASRLLDLAKQQNVTLFDVLLAIHSCWLCRVSGSDAVVIGVPHHGRDDQGIGKNMLGCFIKMMALRLQPKGSFKEFLNVTASTKTDGLRHASIPPMLLFEAAAEEGSGIMEVPYQTVLSYHSDRYNLAGIRKVIGEHAFGGNIQARLLPLQPRTAKLDVELIVARAQDDNGEPALCAELLFAADLFTEASCRRMAQQFQTLTQAIVDDVDHDVRTLPLMTGADEFALEGFNGPAAALQPVLPVRLLEAAQKWPAAVAVELDTGARLNYAELWQLSQKLAAHLSTHAQVCADVLVPLLMERSLEMVIAVHGVMAAGGAYVPVDVTTPATRLELIFKDVNGHNSSLPNSPFTTLITHSLAYTQLTLESGIQDLCESIIRLDSETIDRLPSGAWRFSAPSPDNLCYAIFTSGSTGKPKGVLVHHAGLANYVANRQLIWPLSPSSVLMLKTPYTFDVSLHELMWPLLAAAKLVVAKPGGHRDPQYIAGLIQEKGVTHIHFVPSMLDAFLQHLEAASCALPSLRCVSSSGEALDITVCRAFFRLMPEVELHDLYGPTEATVEVTHLRCSAAILHKEKTIGKPLRGVECYVVEQDSCQRVPVGVRGELLLGGVQVARGYVSCGDAKCAAFIENPFRAGSRAYRTGDAVKWQEDGQVTYLGRLDAQVKLYGLRIELGELEAAAMHTPGVRGAIALLCSDSCEVKELVLYVTPKDVNPQTVLQQCRKELPPYIVPSDVVCIDTFPLTSSGKVDRKKLARPQIKANSSLALLWNKLRDVPLAAAMSDDDVKSQGWNSLQVMRAHSQMLQAQRQQGAGQTPGQASACSLPCCKDADPRSEVGREVQMQREHGLMALVGHLWFVTQCLVLLEWVVAYWSWYNAVPAVEGRFTLSEWPTLEKLCALGRYIGDPMFVILASIQDMRDVSLGNTEQLCRRFALFAIIALLGTFGNLLVLQGPYRQLGWIRAEWASDLKAPGGVLNGAVFTYARATFMPFAMLLSKRCPCGWIRFGPIEWPWASLALALLVPSLYQGLQATGGSATTDVDFLSYVRRYASFIIELSPYYFVYPLLVGGIRFPAYISNRKVSLAWPTALAATFVGMAGFLVALYYIDVPTIQKVDAGQSHAVWQEALKATVNPQGTWILGNAIGNYMDLYFGARVGVLMILAALACPVTPTVFSLLGTRVLGTYLTLPLSLTAAGHFIGPALLGADGPWKFISVQSGMIVLLVLVTALTAQPLPDWVLLWAQGNAEWEVAGLFLGKKTRKCK